MSLQEEMLEKFNQSERMAIKTLTEVVEAKKDFMGAYNMANNYEHHESINIPFAAYETQLERFQEEKRELMESHEKEKDKIRKHYRSIVIAVCAVLTAMIVSVAILAMYFVYNFAIEIPSVEQTASGWNDAVIYDGIHLNK